MSQSPNVSLSVSGMIYCSNIKHRQNSFASEPTRQSVCVYREWAVQLLLLLQAMTSRVGGSHLVNTGATGVSNYSPLSWDCGLVLINFLTASVCMGGMHGHEHD